MSKFETTFWKLPEFLRLLERYAGMTFAEAARSSSSPMAVLADEVARRHDGAGYKFGVHADNAAEALGSDAVAVRLKSGNGILIGAGALADEEIGSVRHGIGELTPLDAVLVATDTVTSLNGPYMLVRYDQLACYANPYMKGPNDIWDGYGAVLSECRSVVVNIERDFEIASMPYYKFRNMGECDAYSVDEVRRALDANGGKLEATEKLDGSMVQMRFLPGEDAFDDGILFSTSKALAGSEQARGNVHIREIRRRYIDGGSPQVDMARAHPELTFVFEFVHPDCDRHVVMYDEARHGMYLTGARRDDGRLLSHGELAEVAGGFGVPVARLVADDLDDVLALQRSGDGSKMEGVVINVGGWLVKAKLDGFLELSFLYHELEGPNGFKSIGKMHDGDSLDDAAPVMPAPMREYVEAVVARLNRYDDEMRSAVESLMADGPGADDKKAYAAYVNSLAVPRYWRGWLFRAAKSGAASIKHFWCDEKGAETRYLGKSEFEQREADLEAWESERLG